MSAPEEGQVEKSKHKLWKIVAPVIVLVILVPVLMYVYGYVVLDDAYSKSWATIEVSDSSYSDPESLYEEFEVEEEAPITNPSGTNIRFIEVNYDCWVDGEIWADIHERDVYLPAGGSTTLTHTTYYSSEITGILLSDSYEVKTRREVVASTDILFLTVTRTFLYENLETNYNVW